MTDTKDFICPIDERVKIQVLKDTDIVPHCTTNLPNQDCGYIALGCIGCRFDKEFVLNFQAKHLEQIDALKNNRLQSI